MEKVASTKHFFDLSFRVDKSALFPKTSAKPPSKMDFPAPVSPVMLVIPLEKFTSKWSLSAKLEIVSYLPKGINLVRQNVATIGASICFSALPGASIIAAIKIATR